MNKNQEKFLDLVKSKERDSEFEAYCYSIINRKAILSEIYRIEKNLEGHDFKPHNRNPFSPGNDYIRIIEPTKILIKDTVGISSLNYLPYVSIYKIGKRGKPTEKEIPYVRNFGEIPLQIFLDKEEMIREYVEDMKIYKQYLNLYERYQQKEFISRKKERLDMIEENVNKIIQL